jgi:predicted ArsR family transcriptional regulator
MRKRGETKQMMLRLLEQKPMTVLQLMLELNISASTARKHLKALSIQGKVKTCRNYEEAFERSRRTAHIWEVT